MFRSLSMTLPYQPSFPKLSFNTIQRNKLKTATHIIVVSAALGLSYPVFGDGFEKILPFVNGFTIGLVGGIVISVLELFIFTAISANFSFFKILLIKITAYMMIFTALITAVILVSRSYEYERGIVETLYSKEFQHFIFKEDFVLINLYTLLFVTIVIFTRQMSRKMGQGVLLDFITGKYHQPVEEERIFMFLDINSSTSIAEKLGHKKYHHFLNDFYYDITESILINQGEIYQYVGDEVVITWPLKKGLKDAQCLRTFAHARQAIYRHRLKYLSKYGFVPEFKAGYHCGAVIRGEVGEIKSQIVFHGDVVNTAARIERQCAEFGISILLSEDLVELLDTNLRGYTSFVTQIQLRGKSKKMNLYALSGFQNYEDESNTGN